MNNLLSPRNLYLFEPNADKAAELESEFGLQLVDDNAELIKCCDTVVVAVKPQVLQNVLMPLAEYFQRHQPLVISVVAGIGAESIEKWLGGNAAIVRVMPNTPALVGKGASGLYANKNVQNSQRELTEQLMSAVGVTAWVESDSDIDTVTALSGSGPAYFMLFIKSLVDAAQNAGLSESAAKQLAVQTAAGAAELVAQSDAPLQTLIDNVTSPNGTTQAALTSFYNNDFEQTIFSAFEAARLRSIELANELG